MTASLYIWLFKDWTTELNSFCSNKRKMYHRHLFYYIVSLRLYCKKNRFLCSTYLRIIYLTEWMVTNIINYIIIMVKSSMYIYLLKPSLYMYMNYKCAICHKNGWIELLCNSNKNYLKSLIYVLLGNILNCNIIF